MPFGGLVTPASVERGEISLGTPGRQHGPGVTGHLFTAFVSEARTAATTVDQRAPTRPGRSQA